MAPILKDKLSRLVNPISIYALGILLFALILIFTHRIPGDDLIFPVQIKPFPTVFDWANYRYQTWSGRLFAESFEYIFSILPLIFWKLISLTIFALFSGYIFLYYCLFARARSPHKDSFMMSLAIILPLMMDIHVLKDGMIWITGSMNYFWPACFALVALYPAFHYLFRKQMPQWSYTVASYISAAVATLSQEQIGAVLAVLSLLLTSYVLSRHSPNRKNIVYFISLTLLIVASFVISIKAPGNQNRITLETAKWLPDFHTIPLPDHINYAFRWFIDSIVNHSGLLLAINWLLLVILFVHKKVTRALKSIDYVVATILALAATYLLLKSFDGVSFLFNFYPTWKAHPSLISLFLLAPWTVALIATIFAPVILYGKKPAGLLLSVLFIAALCATALITLSPTMYASGVRVLYVPSILLVLTAYYLFNCVYDHYKSIARGKLTILVCLAAPQYLLLLAKSVVR